MLIAAYMQILDMTKAASIVILLVLAARLILKKAPKVFSYALWAVVLLRLLCPFSMESVLSIMPEITPTEENYTLADVPITPAAAGVAAYRAVGDALNGGLGVQHIATTNINEHGNKEYVTSSWWEVWVLFGQYVWVVGMLGMGVYAAVSYTSLRRKLAAAMRLRENIWLADEISSPFVLGLIHPRIYLPSSLNEQEQSYIILHERCHIRRFDHIIKFLAFLALCIHWFNPLVWVAFVLASKDMEMSCDEAVVKKLGEDVLADYTASLLSLATGKRIIAGMPLAFGEGDPKGRIRNLAKWKKPALWVTVAAVIACIVLAVCLSTDPMNERTFTMSGSSVADLEPAKLTQKIADLCGVEDGTMLYINEQNAFDTKLTADFSWFDYEFMNFFYYKKQKTYRSQLGISGNTYSVSEGVEWPEQDRVYLLEHYLEALKYLPQEEIRALAPGADKYIVTMLEEGTPQDYAGAIVYTMHGVSETESWLIHLQVQAMYEKDENTWIGTGDGRLHLFYGHESNTASAEDTNLESENNNAPETLDTMQLRDALENLDPWSMRKPELSFAQGR